MAVRLFLILLFFIESGMTYCHQAARAKPFYVVTMPKSGTHLLKKLLFMLTERPFAPLKFNIAGFPGIKLVSFDEDGPLLDPEDFDSWMRRIWSSKQCVVFHTNWSVHLQQFSHRHPHYKKILLVRDLKDVLTSYLFFHKEPLMREMGTRDSNKHLLYLLKLEETTPVTKGEVMNLYRYAKLAAEWAQEDCAHVIRYEDLVGKNGKGSDNAQLSVILRLAFYLNISLTHAEALKIQSDLYGVAKGPQIPSTYTKGVIGRWKEVFQKRHLELFEARYGELNRMLGYPD